MYTGKDVAKAVFADVESFFLPTASFKIHRKFNYSSRHHASIVGTKNNTKIVLSRDLSSSPINNIDDLLFICIILCHECTHYINEHNEHKDIENIETTAIEAWADYYGARMLGLIISINGEFSKIYHSLAGERERDALLESLGRALGKTYSTIYSQTTDKRYPNPLERVLTFNAGFTSFFYRLWGEVKGNFTLYVLTKLIDNSGLKQQIISYNIEFDDISKVSSKVSEVHREIQGSRTSIKNGIKHEYMSILCTNYNISHGARSTAKQHLINEARKIIPDFSIHQSCN